MWLISPEFSFLFIHKSRMKAVFTAWSIYSGGQIPSNFSISTRSLWRVLGICTIGYVIVFFTCIVFEMVGEMNGLWRELKTETIVCDRRIVMMKTHAMILWKRPPSLLLSPPINFVPDTAYVVECLTSVPVHLKISLRRSHRPPDQIPFSVRLHS